jgi:hypothetical protein
MPPSRLSLQSINRLGSDHNLARFVNHTWYLYHTQHASRVATTLSSHYSVFHDGDQWHDSDSPKSVHALGFPAPNVCRTVRNHDLRFLRAFSGTYLSPFPLRLSPAYSLPRHMHGIG